MIDIHQVSGHDFDLTHFADGHYYSVPYRSLISNELTNLLVAGRCMSVTHEALGAIRVMVNTMPIGRGRRHGRRHCGEGRLRRCPGRHGQAAANAEGRRRDSRLRSLTAEDPQDTCMAVGASRLE